jgi:hypothetical protein
MDVYGMENTQIVKQFLIWFLQILAFVAVLILSQIN